MIKNIGYVKPEIEQIGQSGLPRVFQLQRPFSREFLYVPYKMRLVSITIFIDHLGQFRKITRGYLSQ